jgi:hypothetical protein
VFIELLPGNALIKSVTLSRVGMQLYPDVKSRDNWRTYQICLTRYCVVFLTVMANAGIVLLSRQGKRVFFYCLVGIIDYFLFNVKNNNKLLSFHSLPISYLFQLCYIKSLSRIFNTSYDASEYDISRIEISALLVFVGLSKRIMFHYLSKV